MTRWKKTRTLVESSRKRYGYLLRWLCVILCEKKFGCEMSNTITLVKHDDAASKIAFVKNAKRCSYMTVAWLCDALVSHNGCTVNALVCHSKWSVNALVYHSRCSLNALVSHTRCSINALVSIINCTRNALVCNRPAILLHAHTSVTDARLQHAHISHTCTQCCVD